MRKRLVVLFLLMALAVTLVLPVPAMAADNCGKTVKYKVVYSVKGKTPVKVDPTAVAKYLDYSSKVLEIETMLTKLGYNAGVVSKFYDYNTLLAVQKFQKDNGLAVTGVVNKQTYQTIKDLYCKLGSGSDTTKPPALTTPTTPTVPEPKPTVPAPKPGTGSDTGSNTTPISGLTAEEQQMINLVNQERTSRGLKALQVDMSLVKTARMKSNDMIAKNYFAHQSPTYGSPFDLMKSQGVTYRTAGENLAGAGSVSSAHTNLMNSSGHRANILNGNFTHIGIGVVKGGNYGMMFTQHFIGK